MMSANDFINKIEKAGNAAECMEVKSELTALLTKVTTKLAIFQEQEKEAGLKFQGENAVKCVCGNTMDPEGAYIGTCEDCEEVFCVDCLYKCDDCKKLLCNPDDYKKESCAILCEACGSSMLCSECCMKCRCCEEKVCGKYGCLKEIGPYGWMYCPACFDHINNDR